MKKIFLTIIVCGIMVLGLTGCDKKEPSNENNNSNNNNEINSTEDNLILMDPVIEWCQLYNPNGFDTITCVFSNPNKVDIDIFYDLVFYKDGKEVARQEDYSNFQVSPKHNGVIWGNVGIPKSSEVDEVKLENITVAKASYESIDAEINYVETIENKAYFSVKHNLKPTLNSIYIFYYNDINGNKKCDKGELNIADLTSIMEKETKFSVDTDIVGNKYGVDYNAYEIFYSAY